MFKLLHNEKKYLRELKNMMSEQQVKIPVKEPEILEIPEGKSVDSLSLDHFKNLIKKKNFPKISRELINLRIWNKERDVKLSKWADNMQEKLAIWVEKERVKSGNLDLYEK